MTEPLVYIVDDDDDLREAVLDTLEDAGLPATGFCSANLALPQLNPEWPGVVVSDIRMPGMGGMEFLHAARDQYPEVPFVVITGHGDVQTAINAMKAGAFDFLEKPTRPEYLVDVVRRALEMRRLQIENSNLKSIVADGGALKTRFIGRSKVMRALRKEILAVAPLKVDVLLLGETGTGKELAAQCIHDLSPSAETQFQTVNCGTLTEEKWLTEIEARLAGADGGVLFLDELEALPEPLQLRLLALIEVRGIDGPRIIASLQTDPSQLIADGRLRADLFYRINVAQISLPPLTERENDLFVLLEFFIRDAVARHRLKLPEITQEMLNPLRVHTWPGNVRELRNAAEKMVIGLPLSLTPGTSDAKAPFGQDESYDDAIARFEKALLRHALMQAGGRKGQAAESLGIPRKRLYLRLKTLGLD
ncbi:sigma-54-dependent transcriptional regulator [Parasedimentitalea maritima]|uniref:Response regulator n=1 Tax=Parasedimentitalea maritima TaxID=2578117 RepID=A0A6A4R6R7_9RHOB|nr:sigma-54 dependent transcriptional regulator [Zongyanglinia marina]KAE9625909.1 response regulator [Zongyanglinia marina]